MIRRTLTAAAVALAVVWGAAMGREAARCVQLERDHRARRRRPPPPQHEHQWLDVTGFGDQARRYECIGPSGCGAARTEAP